VPDVLILLPSVELLYVFFEQLFIVGVVLALRKMLLSPFQVSAIYHMFELSSVVTQAVKKGDG